MILFEDGTNILTFIALPNILKKLFFFLKPLPEAGFHKLFTFHFSAILY